ncbi:MAG: hypothetical protein NUV75_02110 [Gallionella sp.]|nr:hypothetical protein [Gallionella sp.]
MMDKRHLTELPVPLTDALMLEINEGRTYETVGPLVEHASQLERDAMTFALRLYAEDQHTFAPETSEAMERWAPRVRALLEGKT